MLKERLNTDSTSFYEKVKSFDFLLVLTVLLLGIISSFAMYSTDGGQILYHTKSHIMRFGIFFFYF